ncbi:MAG: 16S rRNA (uracil(1498)-N(3))-methyltransferase [Actinomycetota bacterium]|nr:16S rRNA (uracil(1498)-N(3))-methyltransferase [Actinomycetota bacterium]
MPAAELRASAAHVFVADLEVPHLEEQDRHHLERVLRLRPGQPVTVADGDGGWRRCAWVGGGRLEPCGGEGREPTPTPSVTVGFALTKGERPEWVVQKLTEAGVDRIVPFVAARSVVRWDADKAERSAGRWQRVAREAAMQSRRTRLPALEPVTTVVEAAARLGPAASLAEPGGAPTSLERPAVLVGPEGGWAVEELGAGLPTVGLGPTVLRADTAAVAAGLLLCALRAGVVRAAP